MRTKSSIQPMPPPHPRRRKQANREPRTRFPQFAQELFPHPNRTLSTPTTSNAPDLPSPLLPHRPMTPFRRATHANQHMLLLPICLHTSWEHHTTLLPFCSPHSEMHHTSLPHSVTEGTQHPTPGIAAAQTAGSAFKPFPSPPTVFRVFYTRARRVPNATVTRQCYNMLGWISKLVMMPFSLKGIHCSPPKLRSPMLPLEKTARGFLALPCKTHADPCPGAAVLTSRRPSLGQCASFRADARLLSSSPEATSWQAGAVRAVCPLGSLGSSLWDRR